MSPDETVDGERPAGRDHEVIRVLLADDQSLVRAGFRSLLDEDDIEVVAEAADGEEAVELTLQHRPDLVLMDIRMPRLDGLDATRRITADPRLGDIKILILTTYELDEYVFDSLRAGASGFLLKDTDPLELLHALRVVASGDALLAPRITRRLIERFASGPVRASTAPGRLAVLTDREREVMALVAAGLSNDEIGEQLYISPATARTHVGRAMAKLHARDRAQLVMLAYDTGLVQAGHTER